jgi:predicted signal transduction protein with EAL and GGDEF domain
MYDSLIDNLPDLVVLARRDGVVLGHRGGHALLDLRLSGDAVGQRFEEVWPAPVAELLKQLTRKAIAIRDVTEAAFDFGGRHFEVRVSAQAPDRAVCVLRLALDRPAEDSLEATDERPRPELDRRGFLRRFRESISVAALCEKPSALAVIHVDGISDIAQIFDTQVAERAMSAAIRRLPPPELSDGGPCQWYLGQLSDHLLAIVVDSSDRDAIETCVRSLSANLQAPISIGDATFHLTSHVGVAILGRDASSAKLLLNHARAAAAEARRAANGLICFFSDTLNLRSLARLDMARELRTAIGNGDIRLRYVGRHDLVTGRLLAGVGYLRWMHPLRGEVRPVEFLRLAESTGLATALSRTVLECLRSDFALLALQWEQDVRISFGALRHHILQEDFAGDIMRFLAQGEVPAARLELRVAEKTFIARDAALFHLLHGLGVQLVVDEVGRGLGSLDALARAPIWGLQLDRAWTMALRNDEVARKVCHAGISLAAAIGLTPIATGVDDEAQREALLGLGCRHGSGDLYQDALPDLLQLPRARRGASREPI